MRSFLVGAVVFLLALARSIADGVGHGDESWFLQVVSRIRAGETLYREIFLGVTPLAAYATALVTLVTGIDVLAVKIVTNGCFAVTSVLAYRLARMAGFSALASLTVVAAMFVWGRPYNNPPYTAMAVMFLLAALVVSFRAFSRYSAATEARTWIAAGIFAGLSFGAKQNVGLLALAAVCGAIAFHRDARRDTRRAARPNQPPPRLRRSAEAPGAKAEGRAYGLSVAAFALTGSATLSPVVASGAMTAFWEYGFGAKGAYLDLGAISYVDSLQVVTSALAALPSASGVATLLHGSVVILPILVAIAVVLSVKRLDRTDWLLVLFAGAATFVAFPRWDRFHMGYAVPVHLIALGRILTHWLPVPALPRAQLSAAGAIGSIAVLVAVQPAITLARGARMSVIPHFRGALMGAEEQTTLMAGADRLREAAAGQPVFVLSPHAGFWYLSSGVTNPTPMDTPHRTAVGRQGLPWLLDQLATGAIERVCVDNGPADAQTLTEVASYVRSRFEQGSNVGPCTIFAAPRPKM